ncbi:MAG: hypothetical protein KME03_01340 [Aphanocapsa lilacina HA4352-LM1]|jgi:uncharacterized membrane protein|nr:hypothetical protein [Aphanocapsa lilacina HA4352-LM1]
MAISDHWLFALKLSSALRCGLMSGVFFAFSAFVMKALARLQPQGIAAMQSINIAVINPWFGAEFFRTAAACTFLAIFLLVSQPQAQYRLLAHRQPCARCSIAF